MKQLSVRIYDKNENVLKCYLLDMEEKIFILPKLESHSFLIDESDSSFGKMKIFSSISRR